MAFEVTYETLRDPNFRTGVQKVLNSPQIKGVKNLYNVGRIGTLLDQSNKDAADVFKKIVKAHGTIKEDGTFKIDEDKIEDWKAAHAEFLTHKIKVERHKVRVEDVSDVSLTPLELTALEPMLDGLDALNGEDTTQHA